MDKKAQRREALNKRKELSISEVNKKSKNIMELLFKCEFYKKAQCIMTYVDFNNEVKTKELIKKSIESNKKIIIPITITKTKELMLSQLKDYDNELEIGTFGVLEPKKEFIRIVPPESIDLVLVPGVAFDRRGYRIGYGGGYYDRFLKKINPSIPKVALAFDLQIIPRVKEGRYDIPMDYIITEKEIIKCSKKDM